MDRRSEEAEDVGEIDELIPKARQDLLGMAS
jgi:hypothetical protein